MKKKVLVATLLTGNLPYIFHGVFESRRELADYMKDHYVKFSGDTPENIDLVCSSIDIYVESEGKDEGPDWNPRYGNTRFRMQIKERTISMVGAQ